MTGITGHWGALETPVHMAHFTFHQAMKTVQWKSGGIMIETCCLGYRCAHQTPKQQPLRNPASHISPHLQRGKISGAMAGIALHTISAPVNIIILMAAPALTSSRLYFFRR